MGIHHLSPDDDELEDAGGAGILEETIVVVGATGSGVGVEG